MTSKKENGIIHMFSTYQQVMEIKKQAIERLKKYRDDSKLTNKALAAELGITTRQLYNWLYEPTNRYKAAYLITEFLAKKGLTLEK